MKRLRLIILAMLLPQGLFAGEYHEVNGMKLPLITQDELQRHIGFFVLKYKAQATAFAKSPIAAADITTLLAMTGIHRVYPRGRESLHSFQCFARSDGRLFRYCFDFTLEPHARWDAYKSFEDLFNGRSLTQYYICRIQEEIRDPVVDDILIQSATDSSTREGKHGEDDAEKLFSSSAGQGEMITPPPKIKQRNRRDPHEKIAPALVFKLPEAFSAAGG